MAVMKKMKTNMMTRCYSDIASLDSFVDRFEYLRLDGEVGLETFGFNRYLNQALYNSPEWKRARQEVILRDNGCDLGIDGYEIRGKIIIHHMNPITEEDIIRRRSWIFDPEFLICVTHVTHNAIHYGDENQLRTAPSERRPNDTCPWKH